MILRDVVALLEGEVLTSGTDVDIEVSTACGADLMSDVLFYMHSGSLLLTGLVNPQVVITAEVADASALVIVRGKTPPPETIALAAEKGIPLISAPHTLFECCGRLYAAGVESCDVHGETRRHSDRRLQEYLSGIPTTNA
ncbi:MAG: DRTGG domain-containing protein [Chloroflexota bacterium]